MVDGDVDLQLQQRITERLNAVGLINRITGALTELEADRSSLATTQSGFFYAFPGFLY